MRERLWLLGAVAAVACSDPSGPNDGGTGIRFVSGANLTDTVGAKPVAALMVEVRDAQGRIVPAGTVVRFTAVPRSGNQFGTEMFVQPLTSNSFSTFATGETDGTGRTGVLVQFGTVAGPARIAVSVPEIGVEDTARFTVTPGQAARVTILPADTALYTGRTFTLRGGVTDRFGNVRTDPVVYTSSAPGVTVTSAGVVNTSATGRYTVTATAGTASSTAGVSVIPEGTLAAVRGEFPNFRVVTLGLDGSDLRDLTGVTTDFDVGIWPRWIPGSNTIIHSHRDGSTQVLRTVDPDGNVAPFLASRPATMTHHAEPSLPAGAAVVYFSAFDSRCSGIFYCLHRSNRDGSGVELLGTFIATGQVTWRPSSSPDGSRVAFVTTGTNIKVFDYATKTVSSWSVPGQHPSWSPDGSKIAYVPQHGGTMRLINADGTNQRVLGTRTYAEAPISWSSDSKWILARGTVWDLIEVETGLVLPLAHLAGVREASLK
jgi:hypothetical protein